MRPPDFLLNPMEMLKGWRSRHGYIIVFMFLTGVDTVSPCEAPTSPQCFRRTAAETTYVCEWSMGTAESNVTYDLYIIKRKCGNVKKTSCVLTEEQLFTNRADTVPIWVEARVGNYTCRSARTSVVLKHTVKYEAPGNIRMSWSENNLSLSWRAAEEHPALAEVRFRRHEHPKESWENRTTNTTSESNNYQATVVNLLKHTAYQVQIRQRSNQAFNPLWSDWSPVVIVPAELEQKPEVSMTTRLVNGARKVTLRWKPVPRAAAATGVTYSLTDTQSSCGCPCRKGANDITWNESTTYISYSAANISVIASNAAGNSSPAIIQIPAKGVADLKPCDKTLLGERLNKRTCLELYEVEDGDSRPENVITQMRRTKKEKQQLRKCSDVQSGEAVIMKSVRIFVPYLYFEHRCDGGKPRTVQMCLFYQQEGVPLREPRDFIAFGETYSSVDLSWKAIPTADLRGFHTHYSLCSVKISPEHEAKKCHNISASLLNHRLENLTPGAKYNISLAVVTRVGEGPRATEMINTRPQKTLKVVLYFLGLLFALFLISAACAWILRRIKTKIFPPVPKPVFPDFNHYQPENERAQESKEEVDELTLHLLHPERQRAPVEAGETAALGGERHDVEHDDVENEEGDSGTSRGTGDGHSSPDSAHRALRSSREGETTVVEQVDNEFASLIYRNGLVLDVKTYAT